MISKENSLEKQVQSLALLGPFMLLVTLTALLINPSHQNIYVPLIALSGILLCWKWKLQGLYTSLALLAIVLFYQLFFNSTPERIFWELLVAAAVALTFSITALSGKEVEEVLDEAQLQTISSKQQLQNLNDQIQQLEEKRNQEFNQDTAHSKLLTQKLEDQIALTQASEQASEKIREKMNGISQQNESLLRELFQKRHECEKLSLSLAEQIELTQMELEDQKKTFNVLNETIKTLEVRHQKEIEVLQETITNFKASEGNQDEFKNCIMVLKEEKKVAEEKHDKEIEALHETISSLKSSQSDLEKQKKSLERLKDANIAAEECHHKEIETLQKTIIELQFLHKEIEGDKKQLDVLHEKNMISEENHQQQIRAFEKTIAELKSSKNNLEDQKKVFESFREEKKALEETHYKEIEALHEMIATLKSSKAELEKQKGSPAKHKEEKKAAEKRHLKDIEALQKQIAALKTNAKSEKTSTPISRPADTSQNQPKSNQKTKGKGSKTNNWANTILSRWSEPHDLPQ